jgi:hypothetical protein
MNPMQIRQCLEDAVLRVGVNQICLAALSKGLGNNWVAYFFVRQCPDLLLTEPLAFSIPGSLTEEDLTAIAVRRIQEAMPVWLAEPGTK